MAVPRPSSASATLPELVEDLLEAGTRIRLPVGGVSMAPRLRDLDRVVVAPVNGAEPRFGDIVLYRNTAGALVLHRVLRRWRDGRGRRRIQTRGDACLRLDTSIDASQILGRVQRIERTGGRDVNLESFAQRLRAVATGAGKLFRSAIYYKLQQGV